MTDRKLDNMDESAEDRSLGELLRTLERVDAPADFGFKVKARIAQGDADVNRGKGWWPVPVYVYALGMILIVGSAFFFLYQPNGQPVPAVASKSDEQPRVSTSSPLTTAPPARNQEVAVSNNQKTAAPLPGDPRALQEDPFNLSRRHNTKTLTDVKDGEGRWRIRSGVYRLRYDVYGQTVVLHSINHRSQAY